mmetsp:Transcript_106038/g.296819  ORF Transcript_106038/g.296819 Transcript_106038/m.296819 type:complete len:131 (+) Transcript_106038:383-775(+)
MLSLPLISPNPAGAVAARDGRDVVPASFLLIIPDFGLRASSAREVASIAAAVMKKFVAQVLRNDDAVCARPVATDFGRPVGNSVAPRGLSWRGTEHGALFTTAGELAERRIFESTSLPFVQKGTVAVPNS